jgi:hypothetical protein
LRTRERSPIRDRLLPVRTPNWIPAKLPMPPRKRLERDICQAGYLVEKFGKIAMLEMGSWNL